jgi:L-ascorbate metabolism protein UlaG (beta-lactamase superfamily)
MSARVVAPERLDFVNVVTSSHSHSDHLDAETLGPILRACPDAALVIPEANRDFVAERLHLSDPSLPVGMDDGATRTLHGIALTGVPAAHETIERDDAGRCKFLGYVARFGPWTIYHSGDTVLYEGLVERLRTFQPDIALLPINGRAPERRVAGNLNGREAAQLAHAIGAGVVIPCHYDLFAFNTAAPSESFIPECERAGQAYRVLHMGERWTGRK